MPTSTKRAPARTTRRRTTASPAAGRQPRAAAGEHVAAPEPASSQTDPAVIDLLRRIDHPLMQVIEAIRQIILGVSPEIREEIKWKAPSFCTIEHFATFNLREKHYVRLILHLGAKVKKKAAKRMSIEDPAGLLEWLAEDRCVVTFSDVAEVQAKREALEAIVRVWIKQLRAP
jgi:hypothetical protein